MELDKNILCCADSLRLMERVETGLAQLVYLDPPWFSEYSLEAISKDDYLDYIFKTIQQSKRVLSEDGFIFLYSNPDLNVDFQIILKKALGEHNFVTEFVIPRRAVVAASGYSFKHETLLVYKKSVAAKLRNRIVLVDEVEISRLFPYEDERGRFRTLPLLSKAGHNQQTWNEKTPPENYFWRFSHEKLDQLAKDGLVVFRNNHFLLKRYLTEEDRYTYIGTVWSDLPPNVVRKFDGILSQSQEFLNRIIKISTDPERLVIDPFCGSGSMLVEAAKNNRRFIGCDNNINAIELTQIRLAAINATDISALDSSDLDKYPVIWRQYSSLAPTIEDEILSLIKKGESFDVEFKESLLWDHYLNKRTPELVKKGLRAIASFMNSEFGGKLLVGVKDNGELLDLSHDFDVADPAKRNQDGYALFLSNKITSALGPSAINKYLIQFFIINECSLCQITVRYSKTPIFYEGDFVLRNNNQTTSFNNSEFYAFMKAKQLL
jgi:DNA modification methylase